MIKSYFVRYRSTNGRALLGGILSSESSRFGDREDAETRATTIREMNTHAEPEIVIVESNRKPEIYRHCTGAEAQAIGGRCPKCREELR